MLSLLASKRLLVLDQNNNFRLLPQHGNAWHERASNRESQISFSSLFYADYKIRTSVVGSQLICQPQNSTTDIW